MNVPSNKIARKYTSAEQCDLDIKTSNNLIGDIINLSQELNTQIWHKINHGATYEDIKDIYKDVCILSIASNIEIDKAKREYAVNNAIELMKLREKYKMVGEDGRNIKPNFFSYKDKSKGYYDNKNKHYKKHDTTMDYLQTIINSYRSSRKGEKSKEFIPFSDVINSDSFVADSVSYTRVKIVKEMLENHATSMAHLFASDLDDQTKATIYHDDRQAVIEAIGEMYMSDNTMIYLLKSIESPDNTHIARLMFNILFGYPNTSFYRVIRTAKESLNEVVECEDGDIQIYNIKVKKIQKTA